MQTSFKYGIPKQGEIMNIQLCILNAQGIILDNNKALIDLWKQTAAKHDIPISDEFFESFLAAGFDQRNKVFFQYPRLAAIEAEVMDQYRMISPSFHPDIESVTESLKKLGIKIAIVSDTRRQDIYPQIESFMKKHVIEVLVCANEVLSAKPDPNIYFKAAKLSHVKPLHTLVVDDSRNGCYSAHLAYMRSVFYQNALPISERLFKYSYRQISQLSDLIQIIEQENDPKRVICHFLFFQIQRHHFHGSAFRCDRNIDDWHFFDSFDQRESDVQGDDTAESRILRHDRHIFEHDRFRRSVENIK